MKTRLEERHDVGTAQPGTSRPSLTPVQADHLLRRDEEITLSQRYECKYLFSPMLVSSIREFLQPFMRPDQYAARRQGFRYPICSLYLDSDNLQLYSQTVSGDRNRFKLRVRTYSDEPAKPVFFEVKRKINNIVQKRRARLSRAYAARLLDEGPNSWADELSSDLFSDLTYFANHAFLAGAKPVLKIRYMREAYESKGGDPLRVTIERPYSRRGTRRSTSIKSKTICCPTR